MYGRALGADRPAVPARPDDHRTDRGPPVLRLPEHRGDAHRGRRSGGNGRVGGVDGGRPGAAAPFPVPVPEAVGGAGEAHCGCRPARAPSAGSPPTSAPCRRPRCGASGTSGTSRRTATAPSGWGSRLPRGRAAFGWELVVRRPSVVHLHMASYGSFARKSLLAWVSRGARVPVVLHVHGGGFAEFYRCSSPPVRRYVRATLRMVDVVVALGEMGQRVLGDLPRRSGRRGPERGATRCAGGAAGGGPCACSSWGTSTSPRARSCCSTRGAASGTPGRPFRRPRDGRRREVAGPARATELGVAEEVRIPGLGAAERGAGPAAGAHVLVLPSFAEGQPMALLEAIAQARASSPATWEESRTSSTSTAGSSSRPGTSTPSSGRCAPCSPMRSCGPGWAPGP